MNNRHHQAKLITPQPKGGFFAVLSRLSGFDGTRAPSIARHRALLVSVLAGFLVAPAAASALPTHVFSVSFGTPGSGAGQLALVNPKGPGGGSGLAVDDTSGNVYVADTGNRRIDQFSSSGAFIRAFGWGVENGSAELQACNTGTGCQAGLSGSGPGEFSSPTFIAVDNSAGASHGDVYVADRGDNLITKFAANGTLITSWGTAGQLNGSTTPGGPFGGLAGLAVDSTGALDVFTGGTIYKFAQDGTYAGEISTPSSTYPTGLTVSPADDFFKPESNGSTEEFGPTGAPIGLLGTPDTTGLGFDSASDDLYVAAEQFYPQSHEAEIYDFEFNGSGEVIQVAGTCAVAPHPACPPTDVFGVGRIELGAGAAVDSASHEVYAADAGGQRIVAFVPATLPVATTEAPTEIAPTSVRLHGKVNPSETEAGYQFEYGTDATYGRLAPASPAAVGNDNTEHPESVDLSGLSPDTVYHFRLDGVNEKLLAEGVPLAEARQTGEDLSFRTTGPPTVDSQSVVQVKTSSATVEAQINPSGFDTHYRIAYGPTNTLGSETAPVDIGAATTDQAVSTALTGLKANTTYHVRILAENSQGLTEARELTFTTEPLLRIDSTSSTEVTATSATLEAQINPLGLEVQSCVFEYGTSASYGTSVPCEPANLGAGSKDVGVSRQITGLQANTTYHFRVVATNSLGTEVGPDSTFIDLTESGAITGCANEALRTGLSADLPDCRAYELVTPAAKNGSLITSYFTGLGPSFSEDGSRMIASTTQCFAASTSCVAARHGTGQPFAFNRTPSGWAATALAPPASQFQTDTSVGYVPDQGAALFSAPIPSSGEEGLFLRRADGSLVEIGKIAPGAEGPSLGSRQFDADLDHLLFSTNSPWPFDETDCAGNAAPCLYEYVGVASSEPILVGVGGIHDGQGSTDLICRNGAVPGSGTSGNVLTSRSYALSADGRTVFFSAGPCPGGSGANAGVEVPAQELFARVDGELPDAHTVPISVRSPGDCSGECLKSPPSGSVFQGASSDGSKAFFTSTQQLTDTASEDPSDSAAAGFGCTGTTGPGGCNLYLYDFSRPAGHNLIDVSAGDTSGLGPEVQGVAAISPDGSHVYFVAGGVLAGKNHEGAAPTENAPNLYVYDAEEDRTAFIATLSANEELGSDPGQADFAQWLEGIGKANVTPDGRYLVFYSHLALTPDATRSEGPAQIYRYDAGAETLNRVSIGQRGFNDNGNAGAGVNNNPEIAPLPTTIGSIRSDPTMSNDGSRVFFTSPLGLTPGALNDVPVSSAGHFAKNVYEWQANGAEAAGRITCRQAAGCVSLISDGRDTSERGNISPVQLLGASADGTNVFFATNDQLIPADTDTQLDYYDARVEGGFPEPPQPIPCTTSDACHAGATAPGPEQAPATPHFIGPEESAKNPEKCKKGLVRKGAKCIKPSKQKHRKGKRKKSNGRAARHDLGGGK